MILSLAPDLMVRSKIDLAARHYGLDVVQVANAESFAAALDVHAGDLRLVLVDLDLDNVETIPIVREAVARSSAEVIGFCSHVMTDLIREARHAGAHRVMPNSTFAASVPGLMAVLAETKPTENPQ